MIGEGAKEVIIYVYLESLLEGRPEAGEACSRIQKGIEMGRGVVLSCVVVVSQGVKGGREGRSMIWAAEGCRGVVEVGVKREAVASGRGLQVAGM